MGLGAWQLGALVSLGVGLAYSRQMLAPARDAAVRGGPPVSRTPPPPPRCVICWVERDEMQMIPPMPGRALPVVADALARLAAEPSPEAGIRAALAITG